MEKLIAKVEIEVTVERIGGLICAGWEGGDCGSASWIDKAEVTTEGAGAVYAWEHPLTGGELAITFGAEENEVETKPFGWDQVVRGWMLFQNKKWSHHLQDFINENEDAITGDVFVQLCVLGDVVYG